MATRRERVVLDLEDNFTSKMARAAAMTAVMSKELNGLGGKSTSAGRDLDQFRGSAERVERSVRSGGSELDRYSGRLNVLRDTASILGPALVPIAAVGVPAVAGLATQLGAAAVAGGTALLAFQGVGDALAAVNTAALDPTVENLSKAEQAMQALSPAAGDFVTELSNLAPVLKGLETSAASGLLPGLGEALETLSTKAPQLERILGEVGATMGDLAGDAAGSLTGAGFSDFFSYIEHEAPVVLAQMGHALGSVTHGISQLILAAAPLSSTFGSWVERAAAGFDKFASGVSKTQGFEDFVSYVRENGPVVGEAVVAISNALLQVSQAASGFGGPVLASITAVASVVGKLADSDAGPALVALAGSLALVNRAMAAASAVQGSALVTSISSARAAASAAEGFAGKLGAVGKTLGPYGVALGLGAAALAHFSQGQQQTAATVQALSATLDKQTGAVTANTRQFVANQLQQQGVLDAAQTLGLSLKTVTDAALGNTAAQAQVAASTAGLKGTYTGLGYAADIVAKAIGAQSGAVADARARTQQLAATNGDVAGSFYGGTTAAKTFTQQMSSLSDFLQGRASFRDYESSLDDFTQALKTNGHTLDINTGKGRANQAALDNIAATASKVADTLTGVDRTAFLVKARAAFLDAARKAGMTRQAAKGLADQLYDTGNISAKPKVLLDAAAADRGLTNLATSLHGLDTTTASPRVTAQTSQAQHAIDAVRADLANLHDRNLFINVHRRNTGSTTDTFAAGGFVQGTSPGGDIPTFLHADLEETAA